MNLRRLFINTVCNGLRKEAAKYRVRKHVLEALSNGVTAKELLADPWDEEYAQQLREAIAELKRDLSVG